MDCDGGDAVIFKNLPLLVNLPMLRLFCGEWVDTAADVSSLVRCLGECGQLRYVFCNHWGVGLRSLDGLVRLPGLRSLFLNGCDRIADLGPLRNAVELERLSVDGDADGLVGYGAILGLSHLRSLAVKGRAFDSWALLANCRDLQWLMVRSRAHDITSTDDLADAVPCLRGLRLLGCRGTQVVDVGRLHWLTSLEIDDCKTLRQVTATGLDELRELTVAATRSSCWP